MTHSHFIETLMILTKCVFDVSVRLTEYSVTVESVTLRFYCINTKIWLSIWRQYKVSVSYGSIPFTESTIRF